ncbi:MAG: 23S rRNA (pseudouridine(1915)-N(3))-methyltransferase RlmH [Alphaproteobacteria bacterium]|nr:23S rRNA (pseudouridine(1915)-N(3))-methyltransferase RlmH [Alphaproteobacteria bacterium]
MRIIIAAVGRIRNGPEHDLFQDYLKRLKWPSALREVEEKRSIPTPARMAREAELLLAGIPAGSVVVALDERGAALSSPDFATRLGGWRDSGVDAVTFLVGGADGHGDAVRNRAELLLSFGIMTWPHRLARVMLAEQLFRAQTILDGHPYHRS